MKARMAMSVSWMDWLIYGNAGSALRRLMLASLWMGCRFPRGG
jgi:hypothetical protein